MSTALEKAHAARLAMKEAGIEIERKNPIEKAAENPTSLRLAINAKCWDCTNGQREEIRQCVMSKCPLFQVRPYK